MFQEIEVILGTGLSVLHVILAIGVTWHAVLHKPESRTVASWVGLAWLAPIVGSVAYACLGINRIERMGASLDIEEARRSVSRSGITKDDEKRAQQFGEKHPTFISLAYAGRAITGRLIDFKNDIQPLIDGDEAYPEMLKAIDEAKESVALLSYIFDNDRVGEMFFQALVNAHERGVSVRVLVDYVGSRYSPRPTIVKRLHQAGIDASAFLETGKFGKLRYANLRNHRKILVVDGRIGFTGGTNIREGHWLSMEPNEPVQCLHFRIEGPVVSQMMEAFSVDWDFTTGERLVGEPWYAEVEGQGTVAARGVTDGPDEDLDKMSRMIMSALSVATKRVRIVTPYFLPDEVIEGALKTASLRGVEIDVLLPEKNNIPIMDWATVPSLPPLIENGLKFYRTPEPFDHTKVMIVDGAWALIGSTNWDARSLRLNFEYNLECYGEAFAGKLEKIVEKKIEEARPVTLEEIKNRNTLRQVRDGLARLFSPYL